MLTQLIGKKFNAVSRACDMMCLFLGEDYSITSHGKRLNVAEFSFHFQTQWRFRNGREILLASRDIYEPYDENASENWQFDPIGRSDSESSIFDVRVKAFKELMVDSYVVDCRLSEVKDLIICFSNGVIFEQFTPASRRDEEWRLIDYVGNVHMICYDDHVEYY